jgi:hypothetical protein
MSFAQLVDRNFKLLLFDIVVFLVLRSARESLPRETASQEVQQYVADGLEIISS